MGKTKYRNKLKQSAFESYERNPNKTTDLFENMWGKSMKTARKLYNFGKNKEFRNISKQARVFFQDDLFYGDRELTFNKALENVKASEMKEVFADTEKEIYMKRTKTFIENNGENEFEYNGEEKTLEEWMEDYNSGEISKEEMNDIIKQYKEQNPDRSMYYANTEENSDLQNNGFF